MPTQVPQTSFARGIFAPALYGRVDVAAYSTALREARNAIIHKYGGVSSKPGSVFVGPCKTHSASAAPRLIPFQFKTEDKYILEFGNLYMRVIRNDDYVLNATQNITNITQADPAVVTITTHGLSSGDEVFIDGVAGMTEVNGKRFNITVLDPDTFSLQDQVTDSDVDSTGFTAYSSGGTAATIFELTTPYAQADLNQLVYAQDKDVMTITHWDYEQRELTRTDHNAWTLEVITFGPDHPDPTGVTLTVNGADNNEAYRYKVTAINQDTGEESLSGVENGSDAIEGATQADPVVISATGHTFVDGDEIEIDGVVGMTELNGNRYFVANAGANDFELTDEDGNDVDGTGFTAWSSGGTIRRTFVVTADGTTAPDNTIAWSAVPGTSKYTVYRLKDGVYGFIGETEALTFDDNNIDPDTSLTPPRQRNPFDGTGNFPAAVSFYEQRRVMGGTKNRPERSEYSQTGLKDNLNRSSPVRDDDAITADLVAREVQEIRQYVPLRDLLIMTTSSEWQVNSGTGAAFTPSTITQKIQSEWGCSYRLPIVVGNKVLFVTFNDKGVRSINFEIQFDGYDGNDMTTFSPHLFEGDKSVVEWCRVRHPESRIYAVMSDGTVNAFTFDPEQQVTAWTWWDTDGLYKSCAAFRGGGTNSEDSAYFVVNRTINGNSVNYVEVVRETFYDNVRDCYFVDCGLTYDVPIPISGITAADPVVVTTTSAHGLSDGDLVDLSDIVWVNDVDEWFNYTQPDQLNNRRYKVANKTATTFELTDPDDDSNIDGSGFNAYVSGGNARLAVLTISGFDHLAGEDVSVLADGSVREELSIDADGVLTLGTEAQDRASRVHCGLRYLVEIETLDVDAGSGLQGLLKSIPSVVLRFHKSRGLFIGPDSSNLVEIAQRDDELWSDPTELVSGDQIVDLISDWNTQGRIFMRQPYPLPLYLLAAIPRVELEDGT